MLIDMHIHTLFSPCSELSPLKALDRARSLELDGVCFTDHHSRGVAQLIKEGPQNDGLVVLVGQEYATDQGDFLLFGPLPELAPSMPAPQLLQMVFNLGGVAVSAHPFRQGRSLDPELMDSGAVRIIEGINGRNLIRDNERAQEWGQAHGLSMVGGSDAHTEAEVGTVLTEFERPISSQADLVQALKSGKYQPRWASDYYMQVFSASRHAAACMAE